MVLGMSSQQSRSLATLLKLLSGVRRKQADGFQDLKGAGLARRGTRLSVPSDLSTNRTFIPWRASSQAANSPEGPAPTTKTSFRVISFEWYLDRPRFCRSKSKWSDRLGGIFARRADRKYGNTGVGWRIWKRQQNAIIFAIRRYPLRMDPE
jgi:hypothetical protein